MKGLMTVYVCLSIFLLSKVSQREWHDISSSWRVFRTKEPRKIVSDVFKGGPLVSVFGH